jgi:hypothetical protein
MIIDTWNHIVFFQSLIALQSSIHFKAMYLMNVCQIKCSFLRKLYPASLAKPACLSELLTRTAFSKVRYIFKYTRKYVVKKKGLRMEFTRKVHVHIYFSATKWNNLIASFDNRFLEIKKELESGRKADELSVNARKKSRNTLESQKRGENCRISLIKKQSEKLRSTMDTLP